MRMEVDGESPTGGSGGEGEGDVVADADGVESCLYVRLSLSYRSLKY